MCGPTPAPPVGMGEMCHLLAIEEDPSRARRQLTTAKVKERRLAGTVRSEDHAPLAWLEVQGQVVQSLQPPKVFGKPVDDQGPS
jgi:hypothetical protein